MSRSGRLLASGEELRADLDASLEQLRAAEAELRRQNDELVRTRIQLERERERYERLFEFAPVGYLVTDVDGVVLEANYQAAQLLGAQQHFLEGKPLVAYVDVADRGGFRRRLAAVASGARVSDEWEIRLRTFGGSIVHGELAVRAVAAHERPGGDLRWMVRDVEERHRASLELERRVAERTAELRREQARLAAVIEQIPAGLIVRDAPSGRIVLTNREASRLLGQRLRLGEQPGVRLLDPEGRPLDGDEWPFWRGLLAGRPVAGELVGVEGSSRLFEVNAAPVKDRTGEVLAGVVVFQDVTERERRERAEREFVANAAHELQTPLAAIASAAEVLQAGAKEDARDRDLFLSHIETEAERLSRLVRSLLLLARVQTGEVVPVERVRLRPLLAAVAARLRPSASVEVEVRCPSRLTTATNRELLEQAVANLGSNAARYTESGSIVLSCTRENGAVVVEVRDTGPGIPREERERVRRRFTRGEARDRFGFGLGLAIADQAARAFGGRLELDAPAEGTGTVARIVLPADERRSP